MVRKKKAEEYDAKIKQALQFLGEVSEDSTTPRNIRRSAKDAMNSLQSAEYTVAVRASNAVSLLDEILARPKHAALHTGKTLERHEFYRSNKRLVSLQLLFVFNYFLKEKLAVAHVCFLVLI